jgi:hypothetical protein
VAESASTGWVWVRSDPQRAEILVDGKDTGLRTPARVEMPQGEHDVQLKLAGFENARRSVLVRPSQTIQLIESLTLH